jgi:acetyltransferase-like isoleucine patch superfamily enzyme
VGEHADDAISAFRNRVHLELDMQVRFGRWWRGLTGLIKYGDLIGVHGSAEVSIQGKFHFGKRVSIARNSVIQVREGTTLRLGDGVRIGRDAELTPAPQITVGDFTSVQDRCIFLGDLDIGSNCLFAPNVMMSSSTHEFSMHPHWLIRDQDELVANSGRESSAKHHRPIHVEDDCWIGINSVVMRGVVVGRGSVVGANSVVTHSVEPYSVMAGAPARLIGRRLDFKPPRAISAENPRDLPYFYSGFDLRQRTISAFPRGMRAKGRFRLALDYSGSGRIRLEIESAGTAILKYKMQQQTLQAGSQVVSFTLDDAPESAVLSLEATDHAGRAAAISVRRASTEV